jgi:hypothetical protein
MPSALHEVPEAAWKTAANRLNDVGVFADEERAFPDRIALNRGLPNFEAIVREHGYHGRPLSGSPIERPSEGVDFLIYDNTRLGDFQTATATWSQDYAARWRERVKVRVEDWIRRLNELKATIKSWLPSGLTIIDRPRISMREELMTRFGIPAAEMPSFEVHQGESKLMRVQPKGLWIVGANGRVDVITPTGSFILVDRSTPLSHQPDWFYSDPSQRTSLTRLTKETFLDILGQ